jgi:hypothetical protein
MAKSREPKTHFEQVPLEIVKKIAEEDIPDDDLGGANVTGETPAKKCSAFPRSRSRTMKAQ